MGNEIITKSHLIGIIVGLILILCVAIYGLANKTNCYEEIKTNSKDNCFQINGFELYVDRELKWEGSIDDNRMPITSIQVIINDTWHEIVLYPTREDVCLNFSNDRDFNKIKIREFSK